MLRCLFFEDFGDDAGGDPAAFLFLKRKTKKETRFSGPLLCCVAYFSRISVTTPEAIRRPFFF
jgi:hypothetical protein